MERCRGKPVQIMIAKFEARMLAGDKQSWRLA
jgi:hypothetical protein